MEFIKANELLPSKTIETKHINDSQFWKWIENVKPTLIAKCNTLSDYKEIRNMLNEYSVEKFKNTETSKDGQFLLFNSGKLNIDPTRPIPFSLDAITRSKNNKYLLFTFFNIMKDANPEDQKYIPSELKDKYIILRNKPNLGGNGFDDWYRNSTRNSRGEIINCIAPNKNPEASMSAWHQFLCVKSDEWDLFNAMTFGFGKKSSDMLNMLLELKLIALAWAKDKNIDESDLGCYFHVYPFNSVNSLHMHMVDKSIASRGAAWAINEPKNMDILSIIEYFMNG